jgi:hypothetical protein
MSVLLTAITAPAGLHGILVTFLILVIVLAIIGGLVWCIEKWIHPLPPPVKLVLAIILVILVIIWALNIFMTG